MSYWITRDYSKYKKSKWLGRDESSVKLVITRTKPDGTKTVKIRKDLYRRNPTTVDEDEK